MAVINSVRVHHGDELEDVLAAQDSGPRVVLPEQEADEAVYDEGRAGLAGMDAGGQEDALLPGEEEGAAVARLIGEYVTTNRGAVRRSAARKAANVSSLTTAEST